MMDRECGTEQPKMVIAKENLKKPKQTQKKTSEQIVFVGLWVRHLLESQNLTIPRGISEKGRKGLRMAKSTAKLFSVGQFCDYGSENWQEDTR